MKTKHVIILFLVVISIPFVYNMVKFKGPGLYPDNVAQEDAVTTIGLSQDSGDGVSTYELDLDVYFEEDDVDVENVYWQLSTDGFASDSDWVKADNCFFLCDYKFNIENVNEGEYHLHVMVVSNKATETFTAPGTFTVKFNPLITVDFKEERGSGKSTYTVEFDVEAQDVGEIENVYYQLSISTDYDLSNWVEAPTCTLMCDYKVVIENMSEGAYYVHVKVITSDKIEHFVTDGVFSVEYNPIIEVDFSQNNGIGETSYEVELDLTTQDVGNLENVYYQITESETYDPTKWESASTCTFSCDYKLTIEDVEEGYYYIHVKVITSEAIEYFRTTGTFEIVLPETE